MTEKQQIVLSSVDQLKEMLDEVKLIESDSENYIDDYCKKIKNEIDLKAEEDKKRIDDMRMEFIERIDSFQKECNSRTVNSDKIRSVISTIEQKCEAIYQEVCQIKVNEALNFDECSKLKQELIESRREYEMDLLNSTIITFKQNQSIEVGKLTQEK